MENCTEKKRVTLDDLLTKKKTQELQLDFKKYPDGLIPTVVQDAKTGQIMMVGFVSQEALDETRETGLATFYSRSQKGLWTKGKTSGDTLTVKRILTDCDQDTLIYEVNVDGQGACHLAGWDSCFQLEIDKTNGKIKELLEPLSIWERKN